MLKSLLLAATLITHSGNFTQTDDIKFRYSHSVNPSDFNSIHPILREIMVDISNFCIDNNITLFVTSVIRTPERNRELGAVSDTHVEGRAVDFSIRSEFGWTKDMLSKLEKLLESKYGAVGAYSYSGKQKVIVIHDIGHGIHAHIQVRRGL